MSGIKNRGAGILLAVSSLPSPYGIGTLGKSAYDFVDKLTHSDQTYWQVLPVGQTSYGDSPYQCFSAFAGNPYYIDLDMLVEEGLLTVEDILKYDWGQDEEYIDYEKLYNSRYIVLRNAYSKWKNNIPEDYKKFLIKNKYWIEDYSLFMACKDHFKGTSWYQWEDSIKNREDEGIKKYSHHLKDEMDFWKFIQYEFMSQWKKLQVYCRLNGIKIIGDIPIYAALDSCDVWVHPELYQLDEDKMPLGVAGCPPDEFSKYGQLWGNPLYNWSTMEENDFKWWRKRIKASSKLYDIIRIDHFIGMVRYFKIPYGKEPKDGHYEYGPGIKLIEAIDEERGKSDIIAEDLGVMYEPVQDLLKRAGYPGMKVLMFAFDGRPDNDHITFNNKKHQVIYTGTHDNDTFKGYIDNVSEKEEIRIINYVSASSKEDIVKQIIKTAYLSVADTCIIPMQDILEKGSESRMNIPSTLGNNWKWRMREEEFDKEKTDFLKELVDLSGRQLEVADWRSKNVK